MAAPLGFKTFNTGDVLTAADTNGYLMQGIWVFANATARDAAVTSPQEGNACYLKDTDAIMVYSGSSWVTKSGSASPLTTKGDLYTYSTTDTRLGVGTNGQVLSANSSTATGLEWTTISSGGETLISTTTLSGSNVDLTSIPQTYKHLRMEISGLVSSSTGCRLFVRINSDTTAVYNWSNASLSDGVANNLYTEADSRFDYIGWAADNGASNDDKGYIIIDFWDYTSTTTKKFVTSRASVRQSNVLKHGDFTGIYFGAFDYAITTINLTGACGASTLAGGTVKLYGIK